MNHLIKFTKKNCLNDFVYMHPYNARMRFTVGNIANKLNVNNTLINNCSNICGICRFQSCGNNHIIGAHVNINDLFRNLI